MGYKGKHVAGKQARVKTGNGSLKTKKKGKVGTVILIILLIFVIIISIGLLILNRWLNQIERVDDEDIYIVPPEEAFDEIDPEPMTGETAGSIVDTDTDAPANDPALDLEEPDDEPIEEVPDDIELPAEEEPVYWWETDEETDDKLINILLVGQDARASGSRERSDAMIVCSINPETGKASLISFMRDLYVQFPEGYMSNRMNAAYAFGGFPFLYEVLDKNFGISIDGAIEVNFSGFENVIDAIGGVDIELTAREAGIVGGGAVEGINRLNGEQALDYSRIRIIDSDFARTNRQRNVIMAVFERIKTADITEVLSLISTITPMVTTNMTNLEIIALAIEIVPIMSTMEMESYRIPADDAYYLDMIREMSVIVPNIELNRQYLMEEYLPFD